jgi:hypothetical protein
MRMSNRLVTACFAIACVSAAAVPTRAETLDDSEKAPSSACWTVTTAAPYRGFGYDHIVTIANTCEKPIDCTARTNVNPEPTNARVPAHASVDVVTFRGSPSREFKADVQCKPAS